MRVFRITRKPFAKDALSGEGARRDGGRWNPRGTAMVYCAGSRALAVLEVLAHVDPDTAPDDLVLIEVDIPDEISTQSIQVKDLPKGWRRAPAPEALADLGEKWVRNETTAVLFVPSAVLPEEQCVLLNPAHPDIGRVQIVKEDPLVLDPRLL